MKKGKYLIISFITIFAFVGKVSAGASLSASTSQVYSGEDFSISASISGAATWAINVNASGPVSGCSIKQAGYTDDLSETSKSWSASCNANGTGTINITLSGTITDGNGTTRQVSGSKTVQVVSRPSSNNNSGSNTKTTTKTTKKEDNRSGNNDLKSLEIEDYKISPEFDKNTTEYSLTVPNGVEKIKILAYKDHDNASLSGDDGEVEVKVGENNFEVIVTAENGSKKTYKLKVTVEEKPVIVKINNSEYNVVKNKDDLPELTLEHEEMTLNIDEQEVPAYRIDKIGYVLVGLRDKEGTIKLYKFDSFKNDEKEPTYELFNYIKGNEILLINKEIPKDKIPKNYKKYNEKIDGIEYTVYKINKNSKYSLIYGINIETGKENLYKYDSKEKTLQIYDKTEEKVLESKINKYEKLIFVLAGVVVFLVLLTTIGFSRKAKDKDIDLNEDEFLSKKEIKKIEKDTKKSEKKNKKKTEQVEETSTEFLSKKERKKLEKKAKKAEKKNSKKIDNTE